MQRHLLAATGLLALMLVATPAQAQSFRPSEYDWSGFYAGATVGGAWSDVSSHATGQPGDGLIVLPVADAEFISQTGETSDSNATATGSIEAGWNWQSGELLLGIETDYGWFSLDEQRSRTYQSALLISPPVTSNTREQVTSDWIWTLRPRVGYVRGPLLIYATAGLAATEVEYAFEYDDTQSPAATGRFEASDTKTGWTAGLGGAYMLTPNIIVKGEWLYADFGSIRVSGETSQGFAQITSEADIKANILRVGFDYKF